MSTTSEFLYLGRMLARLIFIALVASIGCNRVEQNPEKVFSTVTAGMTTAEVEKILGPGKEVGYEELPPLYRTVLDTPRKVSRSPRVRELSTAKWSRSADEMSAICHVAFREGKVVDGTVYVETLRKGK